MNKAVFAALTAAALLSFAGLGAESAPPTAPPSTASEELFVYARTVGEKRDEVEIRTRPVSVDGVAYLEMTTRSSDQEGLFRLDPKTLLATYSDITTRSKDATIRRITSIVEDRYKPKDGELLVSSLDTLGQTLRLFPWAKGRKAKLVFLGSGGGNFSFELSVSGKETVTIGERSLECWKAQVGLGGILGGMFGKSSLWFSTDSPSYLVKSEGPSGGPGSPNSVMELKSYSAADR
jgi:hypothetical protein